MNGSSGGARRLSMEFGWAFCSGSCRISLLSSYGFTAPRDSLRSVLTLIDWRNRGAGMVVVFLWSPGYNNCFCSSIWDWSLGLGLTMPFYKNFQIIKVVVAR